MNGTILAGLAVDLLLLPASSDDLICIQPPQGQHVVPGTATTLDDSEWILAREIPATPTSTMMIMTMKMQRRVQNGGSQPSSGQNSATSYPTSALPVHTVQLCLRHPSSTSAGIRCRVLGASAGDDKPAISYVEHVHTGPSSLLMTRLAYVNTYDVSKATHTHITTPLPYTTS
ncbi:hypothetical protein BaRGS_00001415 [Batillaria attramentaria]|uniref:Uncharacterized protein n=1 Tax=Batillaria attramentaria TaxID=370345 RepID=A0ABD0M7L0_9CAEN